MTPHSDFERLESHLRGSQLIRAADAVATASLAAVDSSATARRVRQVRGQLVALPREGRVRVFAVFAATAAIAHLLLLTLVPAHVAPALPKSVWVLVAVTALVVALFAWRLADAWMSSFVCRLLLRVRDYPR